MRDIISSPLLQRQGHGIFHDPLQAAEFNTSSRDELLQEFRSTREPGAGHGVQAGRVNADVALQPGIGL